MRFADLHLHSHFSDGTYRPEELAAHAQRCGLAAIALTDHDSVEGCPATAQACAAAGVEFIAGTELTAEQDGNELHLLEIALSYQIDGCHRSCNFDMEAEYLKIRDKIRRAQF